MAKGHSCVYCETTEGPLRQLGVTVADKTSGPSIEVPYFGCPSCIAGREQLANAGAERPTAIRRT